MESTTVELFQNFGLALLLGALMGLERERAGKAIAGVRTFPLIALLGATAAFLGELTQNSWTVAAGFVAATGLAVVGNAGRKPREDFDPGLTTEFAMLPAYGVGALAYLGERNLAVALAFAVTVLLYFKPQLHGFSRRVTQKDATAVL